MSTIVLVVLSIDIYLVLIIYCIHLQILELEFMVFGEKIKHGVFCVQFTIDSRKQKHIVLPGWGQAIAVSTAAEAWNLQRVSVSDSHYSFYRLQPGSRRAHT